MIEENPKKRAAMRAYLLAHIEPSQPAPQSSVTQYSVYLSRKKKKKKKKKKKNTGAAINIAFMKQFVCIQCHLHFRAVMHQFNFSNWDRVRKAEEAMVSAGPGKKNVGQQCVLTYVRMLRRNSSGLDRHIGCRRDPCWPSMLHSSRWRSNRPCSTRPC